MYNFFLFGCTLATTRSAILSYQIFLATFVTDDFAAPKFVPSPTRKALSLLLWIASLGKLHRKASLQAASLIVGGLWVFVWKPWELFRSCERSEASLERIRQPLTEAGPNRTFFSFVAMSLEHSWVKQFSSWPAYCQRLGLGIHRASPCFSIQAFWGYSVESLNLQAAPLGEDVHVGSPAFSRFIFLQLLVPGLDFGLQVHSHSANGQLTLWPGFCTFSRATM